MDKRGVEIGLAIAVLLGLSGCESVKFYPQAVKGHSQIMLKREPINSVVRKPSTDQELRRKLSIIQRARLFAVETLKLPDNGSYTQYVDTGRPYAVWNVVATQRYSTNPIEHCFPVAGCVSYRGYFKKEAAEDYAERLKLKGYDVIIGGVAAYSTLGWFSDPVLNTMLPRSDLSLAGLIFHELSHQHIYKRGDTAFNESFATAVELAGVKAWVAARKKTNKGVSDRDQKPAAINEKNLKHYQMVRSKNAGVVKLILEHRDKLTQAYDQVDPTNTQQLEAIKKESFAQLREAYKKLRVAGGGSKDYDRWFAAPLNNASLVLFGDYHGWVSAFDVLLKQSGGDWTSFYASVQALAELDAATRRKKLEALQELSKAKGLKQSFE